MTATQRAALIGLVCVVGLSVATLPAAGEQTAPCVGAWWWPAYVQAQMWERVPYYALYPPVYYSYPVARPYGYSPFAYPPGTFTPEPTALPGAVIENQFVPKKPASHVKPNRVTVAPLRILNPYVAASMGSTPSEAIAPSDLARHSD